MRFKDIMHIKKINTEQPLVSILLPAYRESQKNFQQALDSMLAQTYTKFELLIILDDPENQNMKSIAQQYHQKDSRIKVIENKKNKGLATSLNDAIPLASGQLICRMDADDIAKPTRLENQVTHLLENQLDLVGGRVETIDVNNNVLYATSSLPLTSEHIYKALKWNNCIPHPTWLGTKEIFSQKYRSIPFCEDYDFLLRAALKKYRLGNINEIVLSYRLTPSSISRSNLYYQYMVQKELTKSYRKKNVAEMEVIHNVLSRKQNKNKEMQYQAANDSFNECLKCLRHKRFVSFLHQALKIPFMSREYLSKIYRLFRASLYSR